MFYSRIDFLFASSTCSCLSIVHQEAGVLFAQIMLHAYKGYFPCMLHAYKGYFLCMLHAYKGYFSCMVNPVSMLRLCTCTGSEERDILRLSCVASILIGAYILPLASGISLARNTLQAFVIPMVTCICLLSWFHSQTMANCCAAM